MAKRQGENQRREAQEINEELYQWLAQNLAGAGFDVFSKTAHLDKYGLKLLVHGENKNPIKKKAQEEFVAWVGRFEQIVQGEDKKASKVKAQTKYKSSDDDSFRKPWQELTSQCDERRLLIRLFLFSHPDETALDRLADAWRVLAKETDRLIPKCTNAMSRFIARAKLVQQMDSDVTAIFEERVNVVEVTRAHLLNIREWARRMSSRKPDARDSRKTHARDFYLYAMVREAHEATGHDHFGDLVTLLGIAFAAHGERDTPDLDEASWKRRLQRYIKRMNLPRLSA